MTVAPLRLLELNRPSYDFRNGVRNRYFSDRTATARKLELSFHQLMAGSGDVIRSAPDSLDAVLTLRDFHQKNILRITDLYKINNDPVLAASQLADLRKTLAVQAFRLAAAEHLGNYALAIGGSVIKGDHTVLTDIDSVVIAARDEDQEAARNVQSLMKRILDSVYVESDEVMPFHFAGLPIEKLEVKFPLIKRSEMIDPFLKSMWLSNGSFFRFLMDLQIVDARGKLKTSHYAEKLDAFRDKMTYGNHEAMLELCDESFTQRIDVSDEKEVIRSKDGKKAAFDIKNEALRPFYYALYAARAKYGIKFPSPWRTISELESKGKLSASEKKAAEQAISVLLDLRHLIGFSLTQAKDSKTLSDEALGAIAQARGYDKKEILAKAQAAAAALRGIAVKLLTQLKTEAA